MSLASSSSNAMAVAVPDGSISSTIRMSKKRRLLKAAAAGEPEAPKKKQKRCAENGCITQPQFNHPTENVGLYCGQHRKEGMVNVMSKRCAEEGCNAQPSFNLPAEKGGLYCGQHKKEGMVDVMSKQCAEEGCTSLTPGFNLPTENVGLYCGQHRKEGMVNVMSKRCAEEGCNLACPKFNLPAEKGGVYCGQHKKEGMVDVVSKRCAEEGCNLVCPQFNFPTEKVGLYCGTHRRGGMINIRNNKCTECNNQALFGLSGKRAQYCTVHRKSRMINVFLESKCSILDCEREHDVIVGDLKYCLKHCPDERYGVRLKRLCKYCDIKDISDYVCKNCTKISCKKEWAIVRYLRKTIVTKFEHNSSRMLQGCSKKRPDVYFELPTHCVIVEIDEHQQIPMKRPASVLVLMRL
jgi:hypothetical protein